MLSRIDTQLVRKERSHDPPSIFSALLLTLALVIGFIAGQASAKPPHMTAAVQHLRAARGELDLASPDKGGHRAKAIALVNDAIAEVEAGMAYDARH